MGFVRGVYADVYIYAKDVMDESQRSQGPLMARSSKTETQADGNYRRESISLPPSYEYVSIGGTV